MKVKKIAGWNALNAGLEMKLRAERKLGDMLGERNTDLHPVSRERLLPEGISQIQSHRWQRLHDIPEEHLARYIAEALGMARTWVEKYDPVQHQSHTKSDTAYHFFGYNIWGLEIQNECAEIKIRAECKAGSMANKGVSKNSGRFLICYTVAN